MRRRDFLHHAFLAPVCLAAAGWRTGFAQKQPVATEEPWNQGPEALERWRRAQRQPVWESHDPRAVAALAAMHRGESMRFSYCGGTLGEPREVSPGLVFTVAGYPGLYITGYCHTQRAERTFLVERMELLVPGSRRTPPS
jgi:hypothetical protein